METSLTEMEHSNTNETPVRWVCWREYTAQVRDAELSVLPRRATGDWAWVVRIPCKSVPSGPTGSKTTFSARFQGYAATATAAKLSAELAYERYLAREEGRKNLQ